MRNKWKNIPAILRPHEKVPSGMGTDLHVLRIQQMAHPNDPAREMVWDGNVLSWLEENYPETLTVWQLFQELVQAEEERLTQKDELYGQIIRTMRESQEEYLDMLCGGTLEEALAKNARQRRKAQRPPEKRKKYTPDELGSLKILRQILKEDPEAEYSEYCKEMGPSFDLYLADLFKRMKEKEDQRLEEAGSGYGLIYKHFLEDQRPEEYLDMLREGTLEAAMQQINRQAQELMDRLEPEYEKAQGVTPELKARDPMAWAGMRNNIRSQLRELVIKTLIN